MPELPNAFALVLLLGEGEDLFDLSDLQQSLPGQNVRAHVEQVVDRELETFNQFVTERLGEPLARPEVAILKTYLAWKLGVGQEQEKNAG